MAENQTIKDRIKLALEQSHKSQRDLARELGLSSPTVSDLLNRDGDPPLKYVDATSRITGYDVKWLLEGGVLNMKQIMQFGGNRMRNETDGHESNEDYLKGSGIRVITVPVDRSGKELITYVPVKAQAGYAKGYGDAKFVEKLPAFSLPNFNDHGSFRMFQTDGDSMLQLGGGGLKDGDVVIAQYVEDIFALRDNMVYVVIHTGGVVVKRVLNRLSTSDKCLVLKSDNKNGQHPNFLVHAKDILEVWEYKAHISRQLNFATDLWDLINDLQAQNAILADRVDKMDSVTRALLNPKK